jgi:hypothetical protein
MHAMQRALWILLGSSLAMFVGWGASACSAAIEPDTTPTASPDTTSSATPTATSSGPPPDAGQVERIKGAAAAYVRYEKVVPELHVAPTLCAAKLPQAPRTLFRSEATDTWSHGKKLYYLFASDAAAYKRDGGREGTKQPDSQVLVKESYVAEESAYDPGEPEMVGEGAKFWKKGARASLFVMLRHQGKWEFGTVSPAGEVAVEGTATAGCHDCHDRKPDGLFGLKKEH